MFNQISLFIILLTPVIAYVAGALLYSFVECFGRTGYAPGAFGVPVIRSVPALGDAVPASPHLR